MATLNYTTAWDKANDPPFRNRLRVSLTRYSQFHIQRVDKFGGESDARFAALKDLARVVLTQVQQANWLTGAGLYAVLPWADVGNSIDDDEALQSRIEVIFDQLGAAPIVTP